MGKKSRPRRLLQIFVNVILTVTVVSILYACTKGWPLMLPPKLAEIDKVIITNSEIGTEKEFTDTENMELAVKLINFLNYVPFSSASDTAKPFIEISYVLKDGTIINIAANNTDVYWNYKGHQLKDAKTFVTLTNGIFFFEENAAKNGG